MPFRRWDGYREAVEAALRQLHAREPEGSQRSSRAVAQEREEELADR